jgi:hypothetical protein
VPWWIPQAGLYPFSITGDLVNNFTNTTRSYNNIDQGDVRVDYTITQKDRLYGRISEGFEDNPVIKFLQTVFRYLQPSAPGKWRGQLHPQLQS